MSLVIKEMPIKTIILLHYKPIRVAKMTTHTKCW